MCPPQLQQHWGASQRESMLTSVLHLLKTHASSSLGSAPRIGHSTVGKQNPHHWQCMHHKYTFLSHRPHVQGVEKVQMVQRPPMRGRIAFWGHRHRILRHIHLAPSSLDCGPCCFPPLLEASFATGGFCASARAVTKRSTRPNLKGHWAIIVLGVHKEKDKSGSGPQLGTMAT